MIGGAMLTDMPTCAYEDTQGSARNAAKTKERNLIMGRFNMKQAADNQPHCER
jgi:hypothetical protein